MELISAIKSSFYDPAFYARMRKQPLSKAIMTFVILGCAGFGIIMLLAYIAIVPLSGSGLPDAVTASYPADLVVTIVNGEMSINQPQPYYIKNTLPIFSGKGQPENLVVFDGNDQLSSDLKKESTFVIVKKKSAIIAGRNDQGQVMSFDSYQSTTTIDQAKVIGMVDKVKPYFAPAIIFGGGLLLLIAALFCAMFWVLFHGIYILFPAVIILFIAMMRKDPMKYSEAYMVALYASIPVAIVFLVLSLIRVSIPIPFLYSIAVIIVAFVNLSKAAPVPDRVETTSA